MAIVGVSSRQLGHVMISMLFYLLAWVGGRVAKKAKRPGVWKGITLMELYAGSAAFYGPKFLNGKCSVPARSHTITAATCSFPLIPNYHMWYSQKYSCRPKVKYFPNRVWRLDIVRERAKRTDYSKSFS